jgi:hypothetical protein
MSNINSAPAYIDENRADALIAKWKDVLDYSSDRVKPIVDEHTRRSTAMLLENQENWCRGGQKMLSEQMVGGGTGGAFTAYAGTVNAGSTGGSVGNQDSYATGDSRLPKVLIPMIRRTFPELITNEIVGVQPMSGPVGLAFALRYMYDQNSLGDNTGTYRDGQTVPVRPAAAGQYNTAGLPTPGDKFYQAGQNKEVGWNWLDSRFTGASSSQLSGLGSSGSDFDMLGVDQGVAEILANYEMTSQIPQMTIQFEKTAVEAGTRRLAAKWSIELEQDVKNMNGIDIDNEMTNAMSYEIQAEIDREMIMRMVQVALKAGSPFGYSLWNAASADARWLAERNRDLYAHIIIEANRIAIRNRRGPANFLVATPRVCAILEMLPEFKFMPVNGTVNTQPVGVAKVGTLGGRFSIYRDTRTDAQWMIGLRSNPLEYVLLGYKGPEYYDTGIVYCPYIPVMVQRTIGPNDFAPRVGLMTRYGIVDHIFGSDLYYHVIIVKGLGQGFIPGSAHMYM